MAFDGYSQGSKVYIIHFMGGVHAATIVAMWPSQSKVCVHSNETGPLLVEGSNIFPSKSTALMELYHRKTREAHTLLGDSTTIAEQMKEASLMEAAEAAPIPPLGTIYPTPAVNKDTGHHIRPVATQRSEISSKERDQHWMDLIIHTVQKNLPDGVEMKIQKGCHPDVPTTEEVIKFLADEIRKQANVAADEQCAASNTEWKDLILEVLRKFSPEQTVQTIRNASEYVSPRYVCSVVLETCLTDLKASYDEAAVKAAREEVRQNFIDFALIRWNDLLVAMKRGDLSQFGVDMGHTHVHRNGIKSAYKQALREVSKYAGKVPPELE